MAANTISMYFRVDAEELATSATESKVKGLGRLGVGEMYGEPQLVDTPGSRDRIYVSVGKDGSHAVTRVYPDGLITLDIQCYVLTNKSSPYKQAYIRSLQNKLGKSLGSLCKESNSLYVPIRRGQKVWPYTASDGETLIENDFVDLVYEKESQWQNIRIYRSKLWGNVLVLDGDTMLGESDLVYTQTVCCIGEEDYRGKEVLILGGGDGGVLHELLKENPKHITMAEIDEEVIKGCRTHMRSVCGDSMDKLKGTNYEILLDDCVKVLHEYTQCGKKFDYVINDLTEFPVDKALQGFGYDFETTHLITEMALGLLKPEGKLMARGDSTSATELLSNLEGDLRKLGCDFKRRDVFVPSFQEVYSLYEIWKVNHINGLSNGVQELQIN